MPHPLPPPSRCGSHFGWPGETPGGDGGRCGLCERHVMWSHAANPPLRGVPPPPWAKTVLLTHQVGWHPNIQCPIIGGPALKCSSTPPLPSPPFTHVAVSIGAFESMGGWWLVGVGGWPTAPLPLPPAEPDHPVSHLRAAWTGVFPCVRGDPHFKDDPIWTLDERLMPLHILAAVPFWRVPPSSQLGQALPMPPPHLHGS